MPEYIYLDAIDSTNTYLSTIASQCEHGTVVVAREQFAGRGQRGNTWESEPGRNLTFSILLRPETIDAKRQFAVSEIVSVAIVNVLRQFIKDRKVSIKWPNDIYVDDMKISGILIENSLMGNRIDHSIVGIGLNVNQMKFFSDAPNPVSLVAVTGQEVELKQLLENICSEILNQMEFTVGEEELAVLHQKYFEMLWRNDRYYSYRDCATGELFEASIVDVAHSGLITLQSTDGSQRVYAFKEVAAVL